MNLFSLRSSQWHTIYDFRERFLSLGAGPPKTSTTALSIVTIPLGLEIFYLQVPSGFLGDDQGKS